ncbi:MAG TPA: hypothetical protein VMF55_06120 [Solirubrobacterales bacterium]|nr:hypothetical protein [Solirubrobacterales bacterium]
MSSRPRGRLSAARAFLALTALVVVLLAVPSAASAGTLIADNGFRPAPDGFSFPNYGNEGQAGLDAAEFERLYGPQVCLGGGGGRCVLTPLAAAVMRAYNEGSANGHCFGFATLAELIYKGYLPRFGYSKVGALGAGALDTFELGIEKNTLLQRSISRAFDFQNLESITANTIIGTPKQILGHLLHGALDPQSPEIWTFEIFQYGMKAGHAITPYAVEKTGPGEYEVLVYDNNWPGNDSRRLYINTKKNTWNYYAMVSPGYPQAMYEGNAKSETLRLAPVTPGLGVQPCSFCVGRQGGGSKYNQIRLDGTSNEHARLLVVDAKGRKTGLIGDRVVNQIPGAKVLPRSSGGVRLRSNGTLWKDSPAPVIQVPKNVEFAVNVDGRHLGVRDRETLSLVGPTYDATVENLIMAPHQEANVALSPKGNAITYLPSEKTESPAISLGAESKSAAYNITVAALGAPKGAALTFVKEPKQQLMWFGDDTQQKRTYGVRIKRYTANNSMREFAATVTIKGNQQAFLYYGPLAKRNGHAKLVVYTPGHRNHPVEESPIEVVG